MTAYVNVLARIDAIALFSEAPEFRDWCQELRTAADELIEALRLAETTIADSLDAAGYEPGSSVDAWVPAVGAQVAALARIRSALAGVGGSKPLTMSQQAHEAQERG